MRFYRKLKSFVRKYIYIIYTIVNKLSFTMNGIYYGKDLKVYGKIFVQNPKGLINIGEHVTINSASWANPIGNGDRVYFQVIGDGNITIGDFTGISNTAFTCAKSINIGKNVLIGSGCKIYDTDFHPIHYLHRVGEEKDNRQTKSSPIVIKDNAFIGGGVYILKGTHIGENSVVGAGSVVAGNIPSNQIWAGNPARFIKNID